MEMNNNVHQMDLPEMSPEDITWESGRAHASVCYAELTLIYRAEQKIKAMLEKYGDNEGFKHYAKQMRIEHHLDQYRD